MYWDRRTDKNHAHNRPDISLRKKNEITNDAKNRKQNGKRKMNLAMKSRCFVKHIK